MRELLPIGSVVLLKGANKRLMVIGRMQKQIDADKVWDYSGCYYPEGLLNLEQTFLFNNENIEKVYFLGFQDYEEIKFLEYLAETLPEYMMSNKDENKDKAK